VFQIYLLRYKDPDIVLMQNYMLVDIQTEKVVDVEGDGTH